VREEVFGRGRDIIDKVVVFEAAMESWIRVFGEGGTLIVNICILYISIVMLCTSFARSKRLKLKKTKYVTRSDKIHHRTLWQKHPFAFKIVVIL